MTQKLWQKKPKLQFNKEVIDIIQFGSSVIEDNEPNDIDIAVIFNKIPVKDQLLEAQKIKKQLNNVLGLQVHIKSFDFYSLFDKTNFAKDNILFYGKSIITGKPFANIFGINPKIYVYYTLNNLEKKDKIRFNYMLSGKLGNYGLLRKYKGCLLKPGLIEINPEYENIFINKIKSFNIKFEFKRVFNKV